MKTYHLCLSSHDEVMYRDEEDFNYGFNCFAVAALETESRALCDSFLANHHHLGAMSNDPCALMFRSRNAYARYFNKKYHRKGALGERNAFILELCGVRHQTAAYSYILRQALHHGISSTPFGYRFSSVNILFKEALGKENVPRFIDGNHRYRYLPWHVHVPDEYRMTDDGLLLREDIEDVSYMENLYLSPRNFLYQMNRKSGEEWSREQREEAPEEPVITLDMIEQGVADVSVAAMMHNENGRIDDRVMKDIELCSLIDNIYVPRHSRGRAATIYDLTFSERASIGNEVFRDLRSAGAGRQPGQLVKTATVEQIKRCAVIK